MMKCVRLHEYGGAEQLRVEQMAAPHPGEGEVLVEVAGAGVNPVDTKVRSGILKDLLPLTFPCVLGADFAGTIVAVGPGVDQSRIGERVMGMVDVLRGGAYAERMTADSERAVPVPDGLDLMDAAALPMGVMTGYDLIELGLDVQSGEKVVVTGAAGSVGRAAVFAAAERGAQVIALVRSTPDTPISGASAVIELGDKAAIAQAAPFDCVADTVGGDLAAELCGYLRAGGRFSTVVGALAPLQPSNGAYSVSAVVVSPRAEPLARFAKAMVSGKAELPTARQMPLEDAAQAHELLAGGGVGRKLVLVPTI